MVDDCLSVGQEVPKLEMHVLIVLQERDQLLHLLSRQLSIKRVVDQSHAASLMVSTQHSTTIPVYTIQSLQKSGIRFS